MKSNINWERFAEVCLDLICTFGADGTYTYISEACEEMLGYSSEELLGRQFTDFIRPDDLERTLEAVQKVFNGEKGINFSNHLVHKNGSVVPVLWSAVWSAQEGTMYCVARDTSTLERAYTTIQRQTQKLNNVLESITDAFLTTDRNWQITYLNKVAEKLLPFDRNKHLGVSIWDIFPEEVGGESYRQYHYALETGKTVSFSTFLQGHGKWFNVKAYPSQEGLSVYFTDVTEQMLAQHELEKLSLVASSTNNSVLICDQNWCIEWVNTGFTQMYGYSPQEAMGKRPLDFLHSPNTDRGAFELLWDNLQNGEIISFQILNERKDGEEIWVSVDISPYYDASGTLSRYIIVQTDITQLKGSELQLAKLTKELYRQNSDLEQFTYIVSHNLRAPVANALGLADLLVTSARDSPEFAQALTFLKQSIHRLDFILHDMNTILSIRDGKGTLELEDVDLHGILNQTLSQFQDQLLLAGANVKIDIPEKLTVLANRAYLYSIFYNLLSNTLKYKSPDRLLEVNITCENNPAKTLTLLFSDNGSGFDAQKEEKNLFKLYKRFHAVQEGKGIGLYLVKNHVEAMGGQIQVQSQVGAGATFILHLPKY